MHNVWVIAIKDLRLLWRDKWGLFWVVAFPLMMAVFFGSLMGSMGQQTRAIQIAVIDEDRSELSKSFVATLKKSTAVSVLERSAEPNKPQEPAAKEIREGATDEMQATPIDQARAEVQSGDLTAYVRLQKGFGETGFVPNAGLVEIGVDPARRVESGLLQGVVMEAVFAPLRDMFSNPAKMKKQASKWITELDTTHDWPDEKQAELAALKTLLRSYDNFADVMDDKILQENSPFGTGKPDVREITAERRGKPTTGYEISFPQSITWGIFGCVSAFAMSLVTERVFGTYLRLRVAPITRAEILGGKGLACFLSCCIICVFLLTLGWVVFGIRVLDPLKLAVAIVTSSACFVGLMMFTSVLGRTERAVAGSVWAVLMPLAMLGGSMVPQFVMPAWMNTAGSISPVKWTIVSLEGAIWRDVAWIDLLSASGILLGMGAVFYAIGLAVLLKSDA